MNLSQPTRRMEVSQRCANTLGRGRPLARGTDMPNAICSIPECARPARARGWCKRHYKRWYRHGNPMAGKPLQRRDENPEQRFWRHVTPSHDGCWEWGGDRLPAGYGTFSCGGAKFYAHRFSYELHKGPIPEGLHIDHICRNTSCVNPDHLEAVTQRENTLRGESFGAKAQRTNRCHNGHPLDEANTYVRPGGTARDCRTCKREAQKRYMARKRASA